jgi:hypothetical protein
MMIHDFEHLDLVDEHAKVFETASNDLSSIILAK